MTSATKTKPRPTSTGRTTASADAAAANAGRVLELGVDLIHPSPDNPRETLGSLETLKASIAQEGIVSPLCVTANGDGWNLIYGHRRLAAAAELGMAFVPCIVKDLDDETAAFTRLTENIEREALSVLDEAREYRRLMAVFDLSQADVARRVGRSDAHVSKRLALLKLPPKAQQLVADKTVTLDQGAQLAQLPKTSDRLTWVLGAAERNPDDKTYIARQVERAVEEERVEKLRAKISREQTAAGRKEIAWYSRADKHTVTTKADDAKAFTINPNSHAVVLLKTKPKTRRAPSSTSGTSTGATIAAATKTDERAARRAEIARAKAERLELMPAIAMNPTAAASMLSQAVAALFAGQIELYPSVEIYSMLRIASPKTRSETNPLVEYATKGSDNAARALLAAVLYYLHQELEPGYYNHDDLTIEGELVPRLAPFFKLLIDAGYTPTADELDLFPELAAEKLQEARHIAGDTITKIAERVAVDDADLATRVLDLQNELETATLRRAVDIQGELDGIFAELNELQPGDVVNQADDGTHTIERADDVEVLTAYRRGAKSQTERDVRRLIERCDASLPRVMALQQQLYDGVTAPEARHILLELQELTKR